MNSDLMKYSVIEAALKTTLDYLEVAPCTDAFFVKVIRKVDKMNTITHLNFGTYDFIGPITKPYFIFMTCLSHHLDHYSQKHFNF